MGCAPCNLLSAPIVRKPKGRLSACAPDTKGQDPCSELQILIISNLFPILQEKIPQRTFWGAGSARESPIDAGQERDREAGIAFGARNTKNRSSGHVRRNQSRVWGKRMKIVKGVAFVRSKSLQEGQTGASLVLGLVFKSSRGAGLTTEYSARLWENPEKVASVVRVGGLVVAEGQEYAYNGETQLRLSRVEPLNATEEEVRSFVPKGTADAEEGMGRLRTYMESLGDPLLRQFGLNMLDDPEIRIRFPSAPAAKKNHHATLGGLLDHTLEILEMGSRVAPVLSLNRDLLLLGLFLHDIGKCWEISSRPGFSYTDEGRLVGHMYLGCEKVAQVARRIDGFPETYLRVLQHFILSHHGEMAYGSPVLPSTPEAMAVHFLDNLSGQVNSMRKVQPQDKDQWGFEKNRGAYIWKKGSDPSAWDSAPLGQGGRKVFEP